MLSAFSRMLLVEGLDDWVMLGALSMGFIGRDPSPDEFILESRAALEPLLREGLTVMGDLSATGGGFRVWGSSVEECLDRFEAAYRDDPTDQRGLWSFGMWLSLTQKGADVAKKCIDADPDPLGIGDLRD